MRAEGIGPGDRVAAFMPNLPETIVIAMLAAACSARSGRRARPISASQGVLDRFGQIEPKVLFAADGYCYGGKTHRLPGESRAQSPPDSPSSAASSSCRTRRALASAGARATRSCWRRLHRPACDDRAADVRAAAVRSSALHPVFVRHDRRAEVHRARRRRHAAAAPEGASAALRHQARRSPLLLHDLRLDDVELAGVGARVRRDAAALRRLAVPSGRQRAVRSRRRERHHASSARRAKFIDAIAKAGLRPRETHDARQRCARCSRPARRSRRRASTTSIATSRRTCCLASISGGTDIVSCFALRQSDCCRCGAARFSAAGSAWRSTSSTRTASPCAARRASSSARAVSVDAGGLLERSRTATKYRAAYFERFPGVWCHGDYVELTEHDGVIIYGRSDATLNPGGVRIGTAEIYRQVEQTAGGPRDPRDRPGLGERRARRPVRPAARRAGARRCAAERIKQQSAPTRRRATCPRKIIAGRRTSRARRAARSSSSRCATPSMAGR